MGGSPCKAWDWRNPIVQTLFTQGATRTAVLRGRRASRTNGRGCPSASARGGAVVPPGPGGRGPGLFRLWTAIYQRPASDPVGREGGGGSCLGRAEAPTSRGGGGGRAKPARPGPSAPAMFGPSGRTPPPPRRGRQNRPGRAEAPTSRGGGAAGGGPPPPPPPGAFGPRHVRPFGPNAAPPPPGTLAYRALSLAPSLVSSTP